MKKYSKSKNSIFVLMLLLIPILFSTIDLNAEYTKTNPEETTVINTEPTIVGDTIVLDTSGDGIGPCEDDRPFVTAEFADDGNITYAHVWFADAGKDNWAWFQLYESESNNKIWTGSFPYIKHSYDGLLPDRTIRWFTGWGDDEGYGDDEWPSVEFFTVLNSEPVVELTYPISGENFTTGTLNITWIGSDIDLFDIVTYDVLYSKNNKDWNLLADNITDTYYVWDISEVKKSDSIQIKVIAGDGFTTTEDITPFVTIGPVGFGSYFVLVLSLVAVTSIPLYLNKQRRK